MKQPTYYRAFIFCNFFSALLLFHLLINVEVSGQELPSTPKKQIEKGIENWNNIYGGTVKAAGWTYEGVIKTEKQKSDISSEMTDPLKTWFPSGEVKKPALMTAFRIPDDPTVKQVAITAWQDMIRAKVKIGQHIVRLKWTKGSIPFTSVCITDNENVVYDNMLSNTAYMDHHSVCFDYRIGYFWQTEYDDMTFGSIKAELKIRCINGTPICDHQCDSQIDFGEIKINCKVETIGNCCKLTWDYAWATGLKSIEVGADGFTIKVTGALGSSGAGNGSCTECCLPNQTTNMIPTMAPVQTDGGAGGIDGPQKLRTISVNTLTGEVVDVKVPNIIRPGDKITGSIISKTQSSTLQGAVVDVENKKTNVRDKFFSVLVPLAGTAIPLLIKDQNGNTLAVTEIPVNRPNMPIPTGEANSISLADIEMPKPHAPGNFAILNYCQPGQPLTINGFFDGNAANTNVSINNIPCEIIAESGTGSFAHIPVNIPAGKASLTIQEGGVTQTMPIQVVTISLTSNKTVVQKNTRAKVTATVKGLENLDLNNNNFKIELTNVSPGVIQFGDANTVTISRDINSSNVKNGTFAFTTDITGIATGSYTINSNLTSTTCTECWKQYEDCIAQVEAEEEQCYKDCEKISGRWDRWKCQLACSGAARMQEIECFAQYTNCMRKKMKD